MNGAQANGTGKQLFIKDLEPNMQVEEIFLITDAQERQARNGNPFWHLSLQDATGRAMAKIWSPASLEYRDLAPGMAVRVKGKVDSFQGAIQIIIQRLEHIPEEQAPMEDLVPSSSDSPEDMLARLEEIVRRNLHFPPWKKLVSKVLAEEDIRFRLLRAYGGKAMHHAYLGGLLEHILSVTRVCMAVCDTYPHLDREVLVAAAILHDLGKIWEMDSGASVEYTDEGRLLGHIHMGLVRLEPFIQQSGLPDELALHFRHLLLSHHGELEFGSPKRPKTPEAMVLHYADNMDAKLNQFACAFEDAQKGDEDESFWTPYQRGMDRFLFKPVATPGYEKPESAKKKESRQCSLLLKE